MLKRSKNALRFMSGDVFISSAIGLINNMAKVTVAIRNTKDIIIHVINIHLSLFRLSTK